MDMTTRYPLAVAQEAAETLRDLLAPVCERIEVAGSIRRRKPELLWRRIPVDLFIVRPPGTDWGVIFTIRTGPADWSQRLVTDCQRWFMRVEGGRLLHHGEHVPCPEERDFLEAIGQEWVEPSERSAERVSLRRPALA